MPIVTGCATPIRYDTRGSGPGVLLVAGTGYPAATWPPEIVDGLARSHTVVTFDHRGTGASPGSPDDYTTRTFAEDAAAVLDAAGTGPAHIVGHSVGGRVAQWLAADRPDIVLSVTLASTGPGRVLGDRLPATGVPIRTVLRLEALGYEGFIRDLQRRTFFTSSFVREHPDRVRWLGDAFWNDRPTLEEYLKHVIARQNHDASGILAGFRVPTLVIVGELDDHQGDTGSHREQAQHLADRIPGARMEILPGVVHGVFWERAEQMGEVLTDWLAGLTPTSRSSHVAPTGDEIEGGRGR
jgi:pimeloyl-ACP methyl ester carboxylesterase